LHFQLLGQTPLPGFGELSNPFATIFLDLKRKTRKTRKTRQNAQNALLMVKEAMEKRTVANAVEQKCAFVCVCVCVTRRVVQFLFVLPLPTSESC
jgi:hypothetical protein